MSKYNRQNKNCDKCRKKIEQGEKWENVQAKWNKWVIFKYCFPCYEILKQEEKEAKNERKREWKQKQIDKFNKLSTECFAKIFDLGIAVSDDLSLQDYKEVKRLEKELNKAKENKELDDSGIKEEITNLQTQLSEIEKKFPERIKIRARKGQKNCRHDGYVFWPRATGGNPYCLNCGDNESDSFLRKFQKSHVDGIRNWFDSRNLNLYAELKKDTVKQQFNKLKWGNIGNLEEIQSIYLELEKEIGEIAEKKGLDNPWKLYQQQPNNNDNIRERERERERAKLQQKITNLENKPDKTPEEETELDKLKNKLKDLDKKQESPPSSPIPLIIGSGCLLVFVLLIVFIATRKKRKY